MQEDIDVRNIENRQFFRIGDFEGPLDILLFLIKKSEINIYDIPIAKITEQYLKYLEYRIGVDLENITDFYLMASQLLYIKSQMLLPVEVDLSEEYEDPRKELVEKLIEYQKYKKLSDLLAEKERETEWIIERKHIQRVLPFQEEDGFWDKIEVWDLLKTFSSIVASLSYEKIIDLYEEVTINEKITLINELLETRKEFLFTELIFKKESAMEIVCAFFAVLELVKEKIIDIYQNFLFGDILIREKTEH
ncbi:MAG: segregation/condensation protein A [Spirochaetes bacterium]|nr:MAG: segregation/condensation protein A [Spirochaetota bacterium]